jgi:4-hydroxybenzoate polyprenyltransferase/phosphoserine phosphatase
MDSQLSIDGALQGDANFPLCVDLDGTLTHTDLLMESFLLLLRRNPLYFLLGLVWLIRGKANFKEQIARRVSINVGSLPYNTALVDFLRSESAKGRELYLCTGSNHRLAENIATHFAFFKGVIGSDHCHNLTGRNKADTLVGMFGQGGFDYVGNESADLPVWSKARTAIVVGDRAIAAAAKKVSGSVMVFDHRRVLLKLMIKEMRVYQWVKNVLIFVPLLASHQFVYLQQVLAASVAFLSFSLCASSVYLLNDMLDLESDRAHARKRHRPFASGQLPLSLGVVLMVALLVLSFVLAAFVRVQFMGVLLVYFVLTLAYSFTLKRYPLLDVFALASLYTIRIAAGGAAYGIELSVWLTLFSVTLFLSLAMVKRYAELHSAGKDGKSTAAGRGYMTADIEMLRSLGTSAGYLSPLVLALYINSPEVSKLYSHPQALWLLFGLMLYWISRIWFVAFHGHMHDDPILFAFKDNVSRVVFLLCAVCLGAAI